MGKTWTRKIDNDPFRVEMGKCPVRQRSGAGFHKTENRPTRSQNKQEARQLKGKLY